VYELTKLFQVLPMSYPDLRVSHFYLVSRFNLEYVTEEPNALASATGTVQYND